MVVNILPGLPVTIRLIDPPLHEFLPEGDLEQIVSELTAETGMTEDEVFARIEKLSEVNPMLGFRGCRFVFSCLTNLLNISFVKIWKKNKRYMWSYYKQRAIYKSFCCLLNRLGISYPELTEMQARAIFQAAVLMSNHGIKVFPEIMVPLVGTPQAWCSNPFSVPFYPFSIFRLLWYDNDSICNLHLWSGKLHFLFIIWWKL